MVLRFACGVTAAFVICEAFGWYPTFLATILTAALLASVPGPLSGKAGLVLIVVQASGALAAFALSSALRGTPIILFGAIGLIIFLSFATIASGRGFLPNLLLLICFSTIPIVTMASPQQGRALPLAFTRGMAVAVCMVWLMHALWPRLRAKRAANATSYLAAPIRMALAGTTIVLPLMLVYLMYGLTDALPVLIATVVLVITFDKKRSVAQGLAMMIGNLIGGMIALLAYLVLQVAPSLTTLTLITFGIALMSARQIGRGGSGAAVGLMTFNQAAIMFSLALMPGSSSAGIWASRLLQFGIASAFAIGMIIIVLPREKTRGR